MSVYVPRIRNLDKIKKKVNNIQWGIRGVASMAMAEYFIGTPQHGLRHYPPKRPKSKYVRTYKLRNGWQIIDSGVHVRIRNLTQYAVYVVGNETQAWMHVGYWRTIKQNMLDNLKGALKAGQAAVNEFIKANK